MFIAQQKSQVGFQINKSLLLRSFFDGSSKLEGNPSTNIDIKLINM